MAVLGGGLAALAVGAVSLPPRAARRARPRHVAVWAGVAVVVGSWQLANYVQHPRSEHPTISSLANRLFESHPVRALALWLWLIAAAALARNRRSRLVLPAAWLWVGWHFFVRGDY